VTTLVTGAGQTLTVRTNGTNSNVPDRLVQRDADGGFAAGPLVINGRIQQTSDDGFSSMAGTGIGLIPATGAGRRMMWYPGKAAFRAGQASATSWNDDVVGLHSAAFGGSTQASGADATAFGAQTVASGSESLAGGLSATASGNASFAFGMPHSSGFTRAMGQASVAMGTGAQADGSFSQAIGHNVHVNAGTLQAIVLGSYAMTGSNGSFTWGDANPPTSTPQDLTRGNYSFVARASGGFFLYTRSDLGTGCTISGGSGVLNCTSSRLEKRNFRAVDGEDLLGRMARVPVSTWSYRTEAGNTRHMGPMAQDFRAAFGLGTDDVTIGHLDISGVTFAGVQALDQRTERLQRENADLRGRVGELERRLAALEAAIAQR
jgi:hypothetical protein